MAPQAAKFHQEANRYDELAQNATTERMRGHLLRLAHHYRSIAEGLQPLLEAPPAPPRAADPVVALRRAPAPAAPAPAAPARAPRAAAPPPARAPSDREQLLRERAYAIWEREGRPHGRDRDHWFAAERELAAGG
jgi:hypothetical protein